MSRNTVWVYKSPSEASEILNAPEELALWATAGYFPRPTPAEAPKPAEGLAQAPETTTATPAEQPPEGSQAPAAGPDNTLTPPDAAGPGSGAPAEAPKPEGKQKKG